MRLIKWILKLFRRTATATAATPEIIKNKKTKPRGRYLWKTATTCVICGKPLKRGGGQIVFFCSKECRRIGRGDKKVRQRRRKMMEYLKTKNERSQHVANEPEGDRQPRGAALLYQE